MNPALKTYHSWEEWQQMTPQQRIDCIPKSRKIKKGSERPIENVDEHIEKIQREIEHRSFLNDLYTSL
jgi:hypothetical protein